MDPNLIVPVIGNVITTLIMGVIGYLIRRDSNRTKERITTLESQREENAQEAATTTGLLKLAEMVIIAVKPATDALEKAGRIMEQSSAVIERLTGSVADLTTEAQRMHQVVERRDHEAAQDRATRDAQHAVIVTRLDAQQQAIEEITKHITIGTTEGMLRHEINKIIIRSDEIVKLVRAMQLPEDQPGETKAPDQTTIEKNAEPSADRQEGPSHE